MCRSNRVSYKSKIVRVDGFEPPKSETPDLQSGANYRIDNTPNRTHSRTRTYKNQILNLTRMPIPPYGYFADTVGFEPTLDFTHQINSLDHSASMATCQCTGLSPFVTLHYFVYILAVDRSAPFCLDGKIRTYVLSRPRRARKT